jgi:hypothetical protein
MTRYLTVLLALALFPAVRSSRAAGKPDARSGEEGTVVWTNENLERLRGHSLISVVGQVPEEATADVAAPGTAPNDRTQDPEWYVEQGATLRDELERRQAQLREYQQALEDARSLKSTTGGVNLDEGDVGITPEAGIEILHQRLNETQAELDGLEDLARRNDIPPGILRGQ